MLEREGGGGGGRDKKERTYNYPASLIASLGGHGRQACELESLNSLGRLSDLGSTPLLKSSSTPKTVLIHDPHTATDCEPHRATACESHRATLSEPQSAQQEQESVMLSNARGSLDCLDQMLSSAKYVEKVKDVKLEESSLDTKVILVKLYYHNSDDSDQGVCVDSHKIQALNCVNIFNIFYTSKILSSI